MNFTILSDDKRRLPLNMEQINAYASRWKPHTSFEVSIVKRQPKVSSPMRKYYFSAVLPPFAKELGYDPDEELLLHNQLKIVFFKCEPDERGIYRKVPSVFSNESELTVPEKVPFVDWVCRKAAQYGVYIPDSQEA